MKIYIEEHAINGIQGNVVCTMVYTKKPEAGKYYTFELSGFENSLQSQNGRTELHDSPGRGVPRHNRGSDPVDELPAAPEDTWTS